MRRIEDLNGIGVPAGSSVWFQLKITSLSGIPAGNFQIFLTNSNISFTSGSTYNLAVPKAVITFSTTATSESYVYSPVTGYQITIPRAAANNDFFATGISLAAPAGGIPGSTNPVAWTTTFTASVSGVSLHYTWLTTEYTSFSSNPNALGIVLLKNSPYTNPQAGAGEPYTYESFAAGGAGSATGNQSVTTCLNYVPLPIDFISFSATKGDHVTKMEWVTAESADIASFIVERSNDGRNWEPIAVQDPKSGNNHYSVVDASPLKGSNYYRLKITETGDDVSYSATRQVSFSDIAVNPYTVYPNPSVNTTSIHFNAPLEVAAQLRISAITGQLVNEYNLPVGTNTFALNVSNLQKGLYIISVNGQVNKLVVE